MKTVLENMKREAEDKRQQRLIQQIQRKTLKIILKRLNQDEIDRYCGKKTAKPELKPQFTMKLRNRKQK